MTIMGAPWWAKLTSTLISQAGLMLAQYLSYKQDGGAVVTLGIAVLQAIQGSIASYGLTAWRAAASLVKEAKSGIQQN